MESSLDLMPVLVQVLGVAETEEGCGGSPGMCVPCEMGRMAAGILGGSTFTWSGNTTEQGRHNSLVSSKITGKCPMSQVKADVSWIFHPSSAACGCLVVGAAWLLPACGTHGRLAALPSPGICFLEDWRRRDAWG